MMPLTSVGLKLPFCTFIYLKASPVHQFSSILSMSDSLEAETPFKQTVALCRRNAVRDSENIKRKYVGRQQQLV